MFTGEARAFPLVQARDDRRELQLTFVECLLLV